MKPAEVLRREVDLEELLTISRGRLVKATDGRSLVVARDGRLLLEKGRKLRGRREMVVAIYGSGRRMSIGGREYLVSKVETRMSTSVLRDIREMRSGRDDVVIVAFSKRARRVVLLYRNGNLCHISGDYRRLVMDGRAIVDAYEVVLAEGDEGREDKKLSRRLMENVAEGG
ncbi:MAG: hypothetical protein GXO66_04460 [Euryarchaeota archaeon]|nr:hypothetical protein [Euryarchaeota archaeon]